MAAKWTHCILIDVDDLIWSMQCEVIHELHEGLVTEMANKEGHENSEFSLKLSEEIPALLMQF